jgi:ferredoxin
VFFLRELAGVECVEELRRTYSQRPPGSSIPSCSIGNEDLRRGTHRYSVASPYDVLGVDPSSSEAAIRDAYRQRVKEAHPDQGGSTAEFRRVQEAYESLTGGDDEGERIDPRNRRGWRDGWGRNRRRDDGWRHEKSRESRRGSRTREPPTETHVEYLNYAVLDDRDWSLDDPDLFTKARNTSLDPIDYGTLTVENGDSLLEAAEAAGQDWPFSCRGGACANCAVKVRSGRLSLPVDHILPESLTERGFQLSCVGHPVTETLQVVYNVKHLPELEELRLPPRN